MPYSTKNKNAAVHVATPIVFTTICNLFLPQENHKRAVELLKGSPSGHPVTGPPGAPLPLPLPAAPKKTVFRHPPFAPGLQPNPHPHPDPRRRMAGQPTTPHGAAAKGEEGEGEDGREGRDGGTEAREAAAEPLIIGCRRSSRALSVRGHGDRAPRKTPLGLAQPGGGFQHPDVGGLDRVGGVHEPRDTTRRQPRAGQIQARQGPASGSRGLGCPRFQVNPLTKSDHPECANVANCRAPRDVVAFCHPT